MYECKVEVGDLHMASELFKKYRGRSLVNLDLVKYMRIYRIKDILRLGLYQNGSEFCKTVSKEEFLLLTEILL